MKISLRPSKSTNPTRNMTHGLCLLAALAMTPAAAPGATFVVSNFNDAGAGSLRQAVLDANALAGDDTITFNEGMVGTIIITSGPITISGNLHLEGPSALELEISGNNAHRLFSIQAGTSATITDLSIRNCRSPGGTGSQGGAIVSSGTLALQRCYFWGNTAQAVTAAHGGAIYASGGAVSMEACTFANNATTAGTFASGGAVYLHNLSADITNCTFFENSTSAGTVSEGAISGNASTVNLVHVTYASNISTSSFPGGIRVANGNLTSKDSLFAFNSGGTFYTAPQSLGHNLCNDGSSGWVHGVNGDIVGADPLLDSFGISGGPTATIPLLVGSPAIDAADPAFTVPDQRGLPRVGCAPDIGAFEVQTISDDDGDGVPNCSDACPATPACAVVNGNGCPTFSDSDNVPDGCDLCAATAAGDPTDANGCSTADEDGDGVTNDADRCRGTPPCAIAGVDADGCPADADGDGLADGCDHCPGSNDLADTDGDAIPDCFDACPHDGDTDSDGVQDCQDDCPSDSLKVDPGTCGCGKVDVDSDGDAIPDCLDACPNADDADADGIQDCQDDCPNDSLKVDPGACGCGKVDVDSDGDGVADCRDLCPNDAAKLDPGARGCGQPDTNASAINGTDGIGEPAASQSRPACGVGMPALAAVLAVPLAGRRIRRHRPLER